jgi:hypothetical protein
LCGLDTRRRKMSNNENEPKKTEPEESDFLFEKKIVCVVCDKEFVTMKVRNSKLRRLEADFDLRPRFRGIDTIKYDVVSCPYCGYAALERYFEHLSPLQIKLVKEHIGTKYHATSVDVPAVYDYDFAIDRYKLALANAAVKKTKISEVAYTSLKLAWLFRGKAEELLAKGVPEDSETIKKCREEEQNYYGQAYDGMNQAVSTEMFPICGMDQNTMDLLLAEMAYRLEKYEESYRVLSRLLTSRTAGSNLKNRGIDLKEELVVKMKKQS